MAEESFPRLSFSPPISCCPAVLPRKNPILAHSSIFPFRWSGPLRRASNHAGALCTYPQGLQSTRKFRSRLAVSPHFLRIRRNRIPAFEASVQWFRFVHFLGHERADPGTELGPGGCRSARGRHL